jgi:hypothetical protein
MYKTLGLISNTAKAEELNDIVNQQGDDVSRTFYPTPSTRYLSAASAHKTYQDKQYPGI